MVQLTKAQALAQALGEDNAHILTIQDAAREMNVTPRCVRHLCEHRQLKGAKQFGSNTNAQWMIPSPIVQLTKAQALAQALGEDDAPIVTIQDAARILGLTTKRVYDLLKQGRISGAYRSGNTWVLPDPIIRLPVSHK